MAGILRVGVLNNFNFTKNEFKQLEQYDDDWLIFVNTNANNTISGKYPVIATINPNLDYFIEPRGDLKRLAAVRIKYVDGANSYVENAFHKSLKWAKMNKVPALITYMRFSSKKSLLHFTINQDNYKWTQNYFRQKDLKNFGNEEDGVYYCDLKKEGCPSCRNCSKLTYEQDEASISSIDLSSSGQCKFNCPDCYAKRLRKVFNPRFDKISKNAKQRGMKHG